MENKHPVGHQHHKMLPVWFFIGVLLLIYGVIILGVSIQRFSEPSTVVLSRLHAGLWGGILLIVLGSFYTLKFWPRRKP
jgi:hypothetical protein